MTNAALAKKVDELEAALEDLQDVFEKKPEGAVTVEDILDAAKDDLDPDAFSKLVERFVRKASTKPKGFKKTIVATWKAGWTGKATIFFAGIGAVVTVGFLLEGLGAVTGWEGARVVRKFSQWYSGV